MKLILEAVLITLLTHTMFFIIYLPRLFYVIQVFGYDFDAPSFARYTGDLFLFLKRIYKVMWYFGLQWEEWDLHNIRS